MFRGVAHGHDGAKAITFAHQRRQPRQQHQILGRANRRASRSEELRAAARHRDDAKAGQRIVERHLDRRVACVVERHAHFPGQQRIEEFARRTASAAASRGNRLAPEVALADDLHLRGRRGDLLAPAPHHGVEKFPRVVRQQFQQAFVDGGQRDLGALGWRATIGTAHLDAHLGLVAHLVGGLLGCHLDGELVRRPADANLRQSHFVRRLRKVDQRGRCDSADAAAHHECRDEYVGRILGLDRQLDGWRTALDRAHEGFEHAFAFDGDQHRCFFEWRSHLQARGITRFVALLLGQEIDAIVVGAAIPVIVAAGDPRVGAGECDVAFRVGGAGAQDQVAGGRRLDLANQQPARVGGAGTQLADALCFAALVEGVETADQASPVRVVLALERIGLDGHPGDGLAAQVQRDHGEFESILRCGPAVGPDAQHDGRWPKCDARRGGQCFTIGIAILHFGDHVARRVALVDVLHHGAHAARSVERQGQFGDAIARAGDRFALGRLGRAIGIDEVVVARHRKRVAGLVAAFFHVAFGERIVVVVREHHDAVGNLGAQLHAQSTGAAAR